MNDVLTLLINLDGSDERLAQAHAQLSDAGIEYERFPAFDARGTAPTDYPEYDAARALSFYGRPMTGGEIGCYKSHLGCAQRLLDSDHDYAIVLEDDMSLQPNAKQCIESLVNYFAEGKETGWEVVNLGKAAHKIFSPVADMNGRQLVRAYYFPVTTTALLWSRKGAEAFLETQANIYAPVDHFFRRFFTKRGTGYAVNPAPVLPSGAESDIDNEGDQLAARKRVPKSLGYFWKEAKRQTPNYLNAYRHKWRR